MPTTRPRTDPDCAARRHGTTTAYHVDSCRCPEAREAVRIDRKRRREGRATRRIVSGVGTRRRLRALAAIGWRWSDLSAHLPRVGATIGDLASSPRPGVHVDTARQVNDIYDLLSMTPGPSKRARSRALAKGWAPPLAWDDATIDDATAEPDLGARNPRHADEVAIRRALNGEQPFNMLAKPDRVALFRGTGHLTVNDLVGRLHCSSETVQRWRAKAGQVAA